MKFSSHYTLWLACVLLLSACSGNVKESLGIDRQGPDAFNVVARPPLSLPPEFSLRAPAAPGTDMGLSAGQDKQAEAIITGQAPENPAAAQIRQDTSTGQFSGGEGALLEKAGATTADDSIRMKLMKEKGETPDDKTWLEKSVPFLAGEKENKDVLNPTKEIHRLRTTDKADAVTIPEKNLPTPEKKK